MATTVKETRKSRRNFKTTGDPRRGGGVLLRDEKGGKFRIIVGTFLGDGPENCDCDACVNGDAGNHLYRARRDTDSDDFDGDIVVTKDVDLCARFNVANPKTKREIGAFKKFERVTDEARGSNVLAQPPTPFPLEEMSYEQLLTVAHESGVDKKSAKRDELIAQIRAKRGR